MIRKQLFKLAKRFLCGAFPSYGKFRTEYSIRAVFFPESFCQPDKILNFSKLHQFTIAKFHT